jgi:hypothetical protein
MPLSVRATLLMAVESVSALTCRCSSSLSASACSNADQDRLVQLDGTPALTTAIIIQALDDHRVELAGGSS